MSPPYAGAGDSALSTPPDGPAPGYSYPVPSPPRERLSTNPFVLIVAVVIGVLLFTGLASFHAVFLIPSPCPGCSPPDASIVEYRNTIRILGWTSVVAMDLAVSMTVTLALIVGGSKGDIPETTRRALFAFATVFLTAWLIFSWLSYSLLRAIVPFG